MKSEGHTECETDLQKLIAYGKVMENDKTLESMSIKDGDFIVFMA